MFWAIVFPNAVAAVIAGLSLMLMASWALWGGLTQHKRSGSVRSVGRISSAEGGYVVRGARTGRIVESRSSKAASKVGRSRT